MRFLPTEATDLHSRLPTSALLLLYYRQRRSISKPYMLVINVSLVWLVMHFSVHVRTYVLYFG
jgi:hypothetical protein